MTGIGGVSVVLDSAKRYLLADELGHNLTEIADTAALGNPPIDPPNNEGFYAADTGGASDIYPKPAYS